MLDVALRFLDAGLSVIPVKADGSKAPALSSFDEYKSKRRPKRNEVEGWFGGEAKVGIAVICGALSGNLAVMDFERKTTYAAWSELCESEGLDLGDLPVVSTPRGQHVYVRLPESEPGRKLASEMVEVEGKDGGRHIKSKVLIEIRGQGQYVVGPGSPPECHPSHKPWELASGPDIDETPKIDLETWHGMIRCAQVFNEAPGTDRMVSGLGKILKDDQRPGTDYCQRGSKAQFGEILQRAGWTMLRRDPSGREIWRRPGKEEPGGSATLGAVTTSLGECLYVFSTNAEPFQADTCYSIFAARALLQFSGDFSRAAGQCRVEGFGAPPPEELKEEIGEYIERWNDTARLKALEVRIADLCGVSTKFKATWNMKRDKTLGGDAHRYTRSILYQAARALGSPEESGLCQGVGMVRLWRQKYAAEPDRALDVDYMARQASDVLSLLHKNEDEVHAQAEAKEAGDSKEGRLAWLSDRFGFKLSRWVQYRSVSDEATFWLETESGSKIKVGDIKSWETYAAFNRALRGWADPVTGTGVDGFLGLLPQSLAPKAAWEAIMIVLYKVREIEGGEDTTSRVIFDWAYEHGDYNGAWDDDSEETEGEAWRYRALSGQPFVYEGLFWLSLDTFLRWINAQKSEAFTPRHLIDEMRAAGFTKKAKQVRDAEGGRKRKKFWVYDAAGLRAIVNEGAEVEDEPVADGEDGGEVPF